jgi:hypothetical protein
MKTLQKILFKNLKHIDKGFFVEGKKQISVSEHYQLICDDEKNEQQILRIEPNNEFVLERLQKLKPYTKLVIVTEVTFYNNKPSRLEVIDILEKAAEIETVENIIEKYC